MRYFLTLLLARLRLLLRSPGLWITSFFFLALTVTFGAILPRSQPQPMGVGLVAQGDAATATANLLLQNADYDFALYEDNNGLERAVMTGTVHCGYRIGDGSKPITVLTTDRAYMRPLLDELVLAAWTESQTAPLVQQFMDDFAIQGDATALLQAQRSTATPMEVELVLLGKEGAQPLPRQSAAQLLLYAVMVSAFLASALLAVMLLGDSESRGMAQLATFSGHPIATHAANAASWVGLNLAVLLLADGLVSSMLGADAYPLTARLPMLVLLAAVTLVFALLGSLLRRYAGVVTLLLPPALLVSIFCSGALVSLDTLPGILPLLRFLSPAWYFLQLLQ